MVRSNNRVCLNTNMACTAIRANPLLCDTEILVSAVGVGALHAHVTSGPVDVIYGIKHLLLTDDSSSPKHLLITILILLQLHARKNNLGSSIDIQVKGLVLLNPLVACLVGLLEESKSFLFLLTGRIVLFPVTMITPGMSNIPDAINLNHRLELGIGCRNLAWRNYLHVDGCLMGPVVMKLHSSNITGGSSAGTS